ncbi:hypothetical protein Tco_0625558, partial [Tanacetum coccineum]
MKNASQGIRNRSKKSSNKMPNDPRFFTGLLHRTLFSHHLSMQAIYFILPALDSLVPHEFDIEIKNNKGAENVAVDHLSRLENPNLKELKDEDIDDNFRDETLMNVSSNDEDGTPWFADFANYLVGKILRKGLTYAQRCKFSLELKHYFWDDPYLFKMCPDGMIGRCVYGFETRKILDECHLGPTRDTMVPPPQQRKYLMLVSIGQQFSKRLILSSKTVMLANVMVAFYIEMRCLKTTSKLVKYSTYGESISWDHSLSP